MSYTNVVKTRWVIFLTLAAVAACVLCLPNFALAEEAQEENETVVRFAFIKDLHGSVDVRPARSEEWAPAAKDTKLFVGDSIRTTQGSSADLKIVGGEVSEVRLMENTEMTFDQMYFDNATELSDTLLNLTIGKILVSSEDLTPGSDYNVQTPTSLVGIRGTMFEVEVF